MAVTYYVCVSTVLKLGGAVADDLLLECFGLFFAIYSRERGEARYQLNGLKFCLNDTTSVATRESG